MPSLLQLDEFLKSVYRADLSDEQRDDLRERVRPHLDFIVTESGVNPREIKRYINAYTLQMRTRPKFDPDIVLGFLTMDFQPDWEEAYDMLLAEREVFTDAVKRRLGGDQHALENLWPDVKRMPASLFGYLGLPQLQSLLDESSLDPYIHSMEATRSTQSGLVEVYRLLGPMRGLLRQFDEDAGNAARRTSTIEQFDQELRTLRSALTRVFTGAQGESILREVERFARRPELVQSPDATPDDERPFGAWREEAGAVLDQVQAQLREVRKLAGGGPSH